jgi:hypothetical protein
MAEGDKIYNLGEKEPIGEETAMGRVLNEAIVALPRFTHELQLAPDFTMKYRSGRMPNRWIRFWQRVLLGWTWREIIPS